MIHVFDVQAGRGSSPLGNTLAKSHNFGPKGKLKLKKEKEKRQHWNNDCRESFVILLR